MFVEKYRPKKFSEIAGQKAALKELISWINTWGKDKKACLLYGPPGVGKTTSVYALANEMNFEIIEMNASDKRNAEAIEKIVGNASQTLSLDGRKKIILLDEADNIYGNVDKGGVKALAKIISETKVPIILIANEYWEVSQSIREKCKMINFPKLRYTSIARVLKDIAKKEGINVTDFQIIALAKNSGGNLRAAINDLENYRENIGKIENLRDSKTDIFHALVEIFKRKTCKVREVLWNIDKTPEEILLWIDENLPRVYEKTDLPEAYKMLSKADIYLSRTKRRQQYKLWSYAMDMMSCGVSVARKGEIKFVKFSSPAYFTKLSKTKSERIIKKSITKKISKKCHCSTKVAIQYLPIALSLSEFFEFEEKEIKFLKTVNI